MSSIKNLIKTTKQNTKDVTTTLENVYSLYTLLNEIIVNIEKDACGNYVLSQEQFDAICDATKNFRL